MKFSAQSRARGEGVAFHFEGDAKFEFVDDAGIEFSAPETGPLAGILFYQNTASTAATGGTPTHKITSPNVNKLIGTVYLPRSTLSIESNQPVAAESAFTVIIVDVLKLHKQPIWSSTPITRRPTCPCPRGSSRSATRCESRGKHSGLRPPRIMAFALSYRTTP